MSDFVRICPRTVEGVFINADAYNRISRLVGLYPGELIKFLWMEADKFDGWYSPSDECLVGLTEHRIFKYQKGQDLDNILLSEISRVAYKDTGFFSWHKVLITMHTGEQDTMGITPDESCQFFCRSLTESVNNYKKQQQQQQQWAQQQRQAAAAAASASAPPDPPPPYPVITSQHKADYWYRMASQQPEQTTITTFRAPTTPSSSTSTPAAGHPPQAKKQDKGPCEFYTDGYCKHGHSCAYSHEINNNSSNADWKDDRRSAAQHIRQEPAVEEQVSERLQSLQLKEAESQHQEALAPKRKRKKAKQQQQQQQALVAESVPLHSHSVPSSPHNNKQDNKDSHHHSTPAHQGKMYTRPCVFFAQGRCKNGEACTFLHDNSNILQNQQPTLKHNPVEKEEKKSTRPASAKASVHPDAQTAGQQQPQQPSGQEQKLSKVSQKQKPNKTEKTEKHVSVQDQPLKSSTDKQQEPPPKLETVKTTVVTTTVVRTIETAVVATDSSTNKSNRSTANAANNQKQQPQSHPTSQGGTQGQQAARQQQQRHNEQQGGPNQKHKQEQKQKQKQPVQQKHP